MSSRTIARTTVTRRFRAGAVAAALVLPLALAGCGGSDSGDGGSTAGSGSGTRGALGSIRSGFDALKDARSASFELSFDDPDGALVAALTERSPKDEAVVDTVVGGTLRVTIDPAGDATLGSVGGSGASKPLGERLTAANVDVTVTAGGGDIAALRLVKGVLYAKADLATIDELATKGGGSGGILDRINGFTADAPPQAAAAIADLRDGKWLRLDLVPLANQLGGLLQGLPQATASAAAQSQALVDDLVDAILPATTATGEDGDYTVEIKAKQALASLLDVLRSSGLPGVGRVDASDLDAIGEGALTARVTVEGDSLKKIAIDLQSVNLLLPADKQSKGGLGKSTLTLTVDDGADEVSVPDDVSSVDLNALLLSFVGRFAGLLGGRPS